MSAQYPKPTRLRVFFCFLAVSGLFYLVDCLVFFREHPELPWFETGIYATSPAGFYLTVGLMVIASWLSPIWEGPVIRSGPVCNRRRSHRRGRGLSRFTDIEIGYLLGSEDFGLVRNLEIQQSRGSSSEGYWQQWSHVAFKEML